jgi:hypothetical protein
MSEVDMKTCSRVRRAHHHLMSFASASKSALSVVGI